MSGCARLLLRVCVCVRARELAARWRRCSWHVRVFFLFSVCWRQSVGLSRLLHELEEVVQDVQRQKKDIVAARKEVASAEAEAYTLRARVAEELAEEAGVRGAVCATASARAFALAPPLLSWIVTHVSKILPCTMFWV